MAPVRLLMYKLRPVTLLNKFFLPKIFLSVNLWPLSDAMPTSSCLSIWGRALALLTLSFTFLAYCFF